MTNHPAPAQETLDLLTAIHGASSLPEALSFVVQQILARRGAEHAVAFVLADGELCPVAEAALGAGAEAVAPVRAPDHPLLEAMRADGDWSRLPGSTAGLPGVEEAAVLPLRGADGAGFGVLAAGGIGEDQLGEAAALLRPALPALARLAEVEALRRRAGGLEKEHALLSAICDALPDAVLVTGPRGAVALENRRARELFHAAGRDETARRFVETNNLIYSSFLSRRPAADAAAGATVTLVDPSTGWELLFEVISVALPGNGLHVSVLRDVTELKRASNELEHQFLRARQSEARSRSERDRLNLILENVGAPIVVTDDRDEVVLMNREAERLFQAPEGAKGSEQLGVRANDGRFARFIGDFGGSGEVERTASLHFTDPATGADFPAQVVSGKIRDERGQTTHIVSVLHDLTREVENERLAGELSRVNEGLEESIRAATAELEERNRQLEWQRRELERAYRLKSEFLASMSHELRTPINALLGYASLMRERIYGELTPRQEEALDRMHGASHHLLDLVNDILDLAKIEAGRMPVHVEPVELADVVRELAAAIEPLVRKKGLSFSVELPEGLPTLETDRTKVKQVLLNLLSNAVKFTHEGGVSLAARLAEGAEAVEVAVADTGIGIAPENLEVIWDDFRQVDQSSTREYGGTGLGLSIVKKLLALLGGSVRVESVVGRGTTFTATLPLRSRPLPEGEEAARAANAIPAAPGEAPGLGE